MTNEVTNPNESAKDALVVIIETAPEALLLNEDLITKAVTKIKAALAVIKAEGMNAEYDAQLNKTQLRLKEILEEAKDRRSPLTKRMDQVKKAFTELEAMVDPTNANSIYAEIAKLRNDYHTKLAEQKKREDEERERQLKKQQERIRLQSEANIGLRNGFLSDLTAAKALLTDTFNEVTLDNFDEVQNQLLPNWNSEYTDIEFERIQFRITSAIYHTAAEIEEIKLEARVGKFEQFAMEYRAELTSLIVSYRDQMPGKKIHLEAAAESRRRAAQAAAEAKRMADEAAAQADKEKREKMIQEAAEAKRKADEAAAEQARLQKLADEKAEADRIKQAEAAAAKAAAAKEKEEADALVKQSQTLFDNEIQKVEEVTPAKVKEGVEIIVKAASGWLNIVSYYFQKKGTSESVEDLSKRTLLQMKTFCEKDYLKTEIKIDSPLIEYKTIYKTQTSK